MKTYIIQRWLFFLIVFCFLVSVNAELNGERSSVTNPNWITSGISVYFTPRGLKLFDSNLELFLENLGISTEQAYFPLFNWAADKPLKIDELNLNQNQKKRIAELHKNLSQWLTQLPLLQFRPEVTVNSLFYSAQFKRFALVADENLIKALGKSEGAVLVLEIEAKKIEINIESIRAFDLDQKDLGEVGVDGPSMVVGPFLLKIPIWVNVNQENHKIEFEALPTVSDFKSTPFEFRYKKLIYPEVTLTIGKRKITLNDQQLEKQFQDQMPQLIEELRGFVERLASQDLPKFLNRKAQEHLNQSFEELNILNPPGSPGPFVTPFYWGMKPRVVKQNNGLWIIMNTFVEDPSLGNIPLLNQLRARSAPHGKDEKISQYDFMLSIDRAFINRILQLSYLRKYMNEVELEPGKSLKFLKPLVVDSQRSSKAPFGKSTFMRVEVEAQTPTGSVTGAKKMFLKDQFKLKFDLITELQARDQGVVIRLRSIDLSSVKIDPKDLTWAGRLVSGTVLEGVQEELEKTNMKWRQSEVLLPGALPLPPEILGLHSRIVSMNFEDSGQLVLYLAYRDPVHDLTARRRGP
jgi:hypothetical protein